MNVCRHRKLISFCTCHLCTSGIQDQRFCCGSGAMIVVIFHTDRPKGKEQPYFRGEFAEARKLSKGIDDDHDQNSITFTAANEVNVKSKSKSSKMF